MTLYSYVVTCDTGFAPNPFFGFCTLACCKPDIRRIAQKGDWIVGLTPKKLGNRLVYFMRVDESIPFRDYWEDPRFTAKKPRDGGDLRLSCGDNIYEPLPDGTFRQLRSKHSDGEKEYFNEKERDLKGKNVLVSENFSYFGANAIMLPCGLEALIIARKHRSRFSDAVKNRFQVFVGKTLPGVHAQPREWLGVEGDNYQLTRTCAPQPARFVPDIPNKNCAW